MSKNKHVLVTTLHRGVFYGELNVHDKEAKTVELTNARMVVYWSSDVRGVLGLASSGPSKNCKVSYAVPEISLTDVTAIVTCSDESVKAWEKSPWS